MKLHIEPQSGEWWIWLLLLLSTVTLLVGTYQGEAGVLKALFGFFGVFGLSWVQMIYFIVIAGPRSFSTQVRIIYTLFVSVTLILFEGSPLICWIVMAETLLITFFKRGVIIWSLLLMPWNRGKQLIP